MVGNSSLKNYLLFFTVFTCLALNAQDISGTITYDVDFIKSPIDTSKVDSDRVASYIARQMKETRKALSGNRAFYVLNFNNTEAVFKAIPMMASDANFYTASDNIYYTNLKTEEKFKQINLGGKNYRVEKGEEKFDWKITGKTKQIHGFVCYQATKKVQRTETTIEVEAWFAPAIPLGFGPKGYDGLPGLILGLEELGLYYHPKSINVNEKDMEIERPSKGKMIGQNELSAKIRTAMGRN